MPAVSAQPARLAPVGPLAVAPARALTGGCTGARTASGRERLGSRSIRSPFATRTPRRRADAMGFDRVPRAALRTVIVILALFPVPWWWFW